MSKFNFGKMKLGFLVLIFCVAFFTSCEKLAGEYGPVPPDENKLLDGPVEGLTIEQQIQFSTYF